MYLFIDNLDKAFADFLKDTTLFIEKEYNQSNAPDEPINTFSKKSLL